MRLKRLTIGNFRSCVDTIVDLTEDLTVLVGENASGKTAIVDAIRLGTTSALEGKGLSFAPEKDLLDPQMLGRRPESSSATRNSLRGN